MNVLFIYPNINTPYSFSPAIQQLSAVLKKADHETSLIHINNEHGIPFEKADILEEYVKIEADIVCITATTFEFKEANEIAKMIRSCSCKFIILGGTHATICPEDLKGSHFDAFCIGEGELPLLELIDKISKYQDFTDIKSFWFNHPTDGKNFDKILKIDSDLSEQLEKKNIPHYKYFNDNTYYFQLKCRQ